MTSNLDALPARFGRYEVLGLIGSGAFADVVRAWDDRLDSHVAIKVLNAEAAEDDLARERFIEEGKLLRRVTHPNVLAVHDIGELDDGRPYLVIDYADGGTLDDRVDEQPGKPIDAETVRRVVEALAAGLEALHGAGVIHRDIKPENLMIDTSAASGGTGRTDGLAAGDPVDQAVTETVLGAGVFDLGERLIIGDLGLAKDLANRGSAPSVVGGSARYQAPEQLRADGKLGPPTDLYAASSVLWRLLSGHVAPEPHDIDDLLPLFRPAWQAFFGRAMAADPSDRYPSAIAWRSAVLDLLDVEPIAIETSAPAAAASRACPYKGLASFQPEDAAVFFGREQLVDDLLTRLQTNRVLVVAGPSGSGKSSLVRAGLLPALRNGALPGSAQWRYELFNPGTDPFDELHYRLTRDLAGDPRVSAGDLAADPRLARRLLDDATTDSEQGWLIYVDQFEEVFTQADDPEQSRRFVDALAAMVDPTDSRVRLVIAVRADFYGRCAQVPWLAQRITENQVLVGPMSAENIRRTIEEPARRHGLRLEPGLVDAVLSEGGRSAGSLPLISHALVETWSRRDGNMLTLEGFRSAGGVGGAIAQSADALFDHKFDEGEQRAARRLLLRLVTPGEGTADTRRRLPFDELSRDSEPEVMNGVVAEFVSARLLAVDDKTVEIAHEALIGGWPRLRDWIDGERANLRFRHRVGRAAGEWESAERDPDLLWRGTPLATAVDWAAENGDSLDRLEQDFIDAAESARVDEERAEAEQAARSQRTRRRATIALAALTIASVAASVVAFIAFRQATSSTEVAERQYANALGTSALGQAASDPRLALLLAMESAARTESPTVDARAAMVQARLAMAEPGVIPFGPAISTPGSFHVALRGDGGLAAVADPTGPIRLYDVTSGDQVGETLDIHTKGARTLTFTSDGSTLFSGASDGFVYRWDVSDPATVPPPTIVIDGGPIIWSVMVDPDDELLAVGADDGTVRIHDLATGSEIETLDWNDGSGGVIAVAFDPAGEQLIATNRSGRINGWAVGSWDQLWDPESTPEGPKLWEIVFSPDGERFATTGDRPQVVLHDAATGQPIDGLVFGDAADSGSRVTEIKGVAFTEDGERLVGGGQGGAIYTWAIADPTQPPTESTARHTDAVRHGRRSDDGSTYVSVGDDKQLRIWQLGSIATFSEYDELPDGAYGAAIDPDGALVAVGDGSGGLHVISIDGEGSATTGPGHGGPVWDVVWSADAASIYSIGNDGLVLRWDPATATVVNQIGQHQGPGRSLALSPDGRLLVSADRGDAEGRGADVFVWATETDSLAGQLLGHEQGVRATAFSTDGRLLATADGVGMIRIWNVSGTDEPTLRHEWSTPTANVVWALAFSAEGNLASVDASEDLLVFDPQTGEQVGTTVSGLDTNGGTGVGFTTDGRTVAIVTRASELHVVDWQQGINLTERAFAAHPSVEAESFELAFDPSGQRFVTTAIDGTVRVWDLLSTERACGEAAHRLDPSIEADLFDDTAPTACG